MRMTGGPISATKSLTNDQRCVAPGADDLVWTDFNPTRGREQAGKRPALVVSSQGFTAKTGLAVVCPITSRIRPFPTSVVLPPGIPNLALDDIAGIAAFLLQHATEVRVGPAAPLSG